MSQDPKSLKDTFRGAGYSTEEAYFFEVNRKNLIDFKQKQKEIEERKRAAGAKRESVRASGPAEVTPLHAHRKKAA